MHFRQSRDFHFREVQTRQCPADTRDRSANLSNALDLPQSSVDSILLHLFHRFALAPFQLAVTMTGLFAQFHLALVVENIEIVAISDVKEVNCASGLPAKCICVSDGRLRPAS